MHYTGNYIRKVLRKADPEHLKATISPAKMPSFQFSETLSKQVM